MAATDDAAPTTARPSIPPRSVGAVAPPVEPLPADDPRPAPALPLTASPTLWAPESRPLTRHLRTGFPALAISGLVVRRGRTTVVDGLELEVDAGEVVALLGSAGSGRSSVLSVVAGALAPDAGEVRIAGEPVAGRRARVAAERRDVSLLAQGEEPRGGGTVLDAVESVLRRRGEAPVEARLHAVRLLRALDLADAAERRVDGLTLDGRVRLALARTVARRAAVYLLDEPGVRLDPVARAAVVEDVVEHIRRAGAAALLATTDPAEALALADRVAVMRGGRIVQEGRPEEVYERPADPAVARLTGPVAVLDGRVTGVRDGIELDVAGGRVVVDAVGPGLGPGARVSVVVRPGWCRFGGPLAGTVERVAYRGTHSLTRIATLGGPVEVLEPDRPSHRRGQRVDWTIDRAWILPAAAG